MPKDAFGAGLRGNEKPKEKPKKKGNIRRITTEKAANGGFITSVDHHPSKKKGGDGVSYQASEQHAHGNKAEALAHHSQAMDDMSTQQEYDGQD